MSQIQKDLRVYSLPKKTQPTANSTRKYHKTSNSKNIRSEEGCPEISEFGRTLDYAQLYTHNLNIDYGKLKQPFFNDYMPINHFAYSKVPQEQDNLLKDDTHFETQRLTGKIICEQNTIQRQVTEKKEYGIVQIQNINTVNQSVCSNQTAIKKRQTKIKQVKAYELLTKRSTSRKRLHSRIVRMLVGSGRQQTRIINYPDNMEYLKLCGLK